MIDSAAIEMARNAQLLGLLIGFVCGFAVAMPVTMLLFVFGPHWVKAVLMLPVWPFLGGAPS